MNDIALLFNTDEDRIEALVALRLLGRDIKMPMINIHMEYCGIKYYSSSKNLWLFPNGSSSYYLCTTGVVKVVENLAQFLESING